MAVLRIAPVEQPTGDMLAGKGDHGTLTFALNLAAVFAYASRRSALLSAVRTGSCHVVAVQAQASGIIVTLLGQ